MWFCIDLGPPNGAKIYQKSAKNHYFGVFGAAPAFSKPQGASQDHFSTVFCTSEPSFRRDVTAFFMVFAKSRQSLRHHFRSDFWTPGGSKDNLKIIKKSYKKKFRNDIEKTSDFVFDFLSKMAPQIDHPKALKSLKWRWTHWRRPLFHQMWPSWNHFWWSWPFLAQPGKQGTGSANAGKDEPPKEPERAS